MAARPVESRIITIRGYKVLLDSDIAELYGVTVKQLNQQIKRNPDRFPSDFAFRLNFQDVTSLKSQIVTSSLSHGGRRKMPLTFTEHGAIMAASVLNSPRAVEMSVFVVRAFVRLRGLLAEYKEIAEKLADLEERIGTHDDAIRGIIVAIKQLTQPPPAHPKRIGFRTAEETKKALKAHAK